MWGRDPCHYLIITVTINYNSDDYYIHCCGQESLRRNGVAIKGKPFNITSLMQVYDPISNAEEAEVEWFYEDVQDLLELTLKKDVFSL